MTEVYQGLIVQIRNEGIKEERKSILLRLLKKHSVDEVSNLLDIETSEIMKIVKTLD